MPIQPPFRVAALVETSKSYGRGILRGIGQFARTSGRWSLLIDERGLEDPFPSWLRRGQIDGIILHSLLPRAAAAAKRTGAKIVNLGETFASDLPVVHTDDWQISNLVARHFIDRGFRQFAFVGLAGRYWSTAREKSFRSVVTEAGFPCESFEYQPPGPVGPTELQVEARLGRWLRALKKPTALMACYDVLALRVLELSRSVGVAVPEEIAVVGVDNDELLCELASPSLSSVAHDLRRIGFRAAELLDRQMKGAASKAQFELIPPTAVVTRMSSDVTAVQDPDVAKALQLIHRHAFDGTHVDAMMRQINISRASLSRRFQKALGRSPKAEILRLRIERVKALLGQSNLKMAAIAKLSGFTTAGHMMAAFKQRTGQSTGEFRRNILVERGEVRASDGNILDGDSPSA